MVRILPPGPKTSLRCAGCGGLTFFLDREEGTPAHFHTSCVECGKRGMITSHVTVTETREFAQFADYPLKEKTS